MDSKKIRKSIGHFFSWIGLTFCSLIIKIIPGKWLYAFAGVLAKIGYRVCRKQRRIALESLKTAFGQDKTVQEREEIARNCFAFMAKSVAEVIFLMDRLKLLKERITIVGRENLDNALSKGKGVILVSAHFGNFPLMLARLKLEGYRVAGIMRPMRDKRVEKIFNVKRDKLGIKTIYTQPRRACVEECLNSLRNNEIIFMPLDQNFGTGGIFVDFFGRKAATATGPVVLAQRTKAAVLTSFIIRQKDNTHKIIFEPPLELKESENNQDSLIINIQRLTDIIESYIRKYPAEWGWIHRRWKTKPS